MRIFDEYTLGEFIGGALIMIYVVASVVGIIYVVVKKVIELFK